MYKYYIYMICPEFKFHVDMQLITEGEIKWEDIEAAKKTAKKESGLNNESVFCVVNIYKLGD